MSPVETWISSIFSAIGSIFSFLGSTYFLGTSILGFCILFILIRLLLGFIKGKK